MGYLLERKRTRDEVAQARTHTQRCMNNDWSEMVSCSPCFAFYCFSFCPWFKQTLWNNSYPSWSDVVALLFLMPSSLHFSSLREI